MRWSKITAAQDDASFFEDYLKLALNNSAPAPPPHIQKIGATTVEWAKNEPGIATIITTGGNIEDRLLAETLVREQLRGHGFKQATLDFDDFRKEATWDDVMAKAKRLIQSGAVRLLRNGYNNIVAAVKGDTGDHEVEISREDPQSRAITQWNCDCGWAQHAFQRTRQWKKYEARPCSHTLAAYWSSLGTPIDEEAHPSQQTQLFNTAPQTPQGPAAGPTPMAPVAPNTQAPLPGMGPPQGPDILPQFPMEGGPPVANPVSVPGLKPPSPMNPVQYPGGTFSKVAVEYQRHPDDWDFEQDDRPGWKWVYNTRDGRGAIGDDTTYHDQLEKQIGQDTHNGIVTPEGLVNVYYWPGKLEEGGHSNLDNLSTERFPPRILDWLRQSIPHAHYPSTTDELIQGNNYGQYIAAEHVPQGPGFENSYMVQLKEEDVGTAMGRSQEHGAGQWQTIPANSIGEVLGQDPTTGWVDVLFTGPCKDNGPMEPFGVQGWFEPSKLIPRPDIARPGPAIRRR